MDSLRLASSGLALLLTFVACGSSGNDGNGSADAGPGGAEASAADVGPATDAEAGVGAEAAVDAGPIVPQDMPHIIDYGNGPVVASPKFVPVFFASDDGTTPSQLTAFLSSVASSSYWTTVVSEYGVGPATIATAVQLTAADDPPATLDNSTISSWLANKLESNDPAFPPADANTIYALFYPPGTSITFGGSVQDGYHTFTEPLDASHGNLQVPYIVVPRLATSPVTWLPSIADFLTFATSHEMVESSTDPVGTSYALWDDDHAYWGLGGAQELADACENGSHPTATLGSFTVARTWSNKASVAGLDPCVPAPAGEVYFNSAAVFHDTVTFILQLGTSELPVQAKGIHIPAGQSGVVQLDLFSAAPTSGPWTVSAVDTATFFGQTASLQFSFDKSSGQSGDHIAMTIHALSGQPGTTRIFEIRSTLGSETQSWYGVVEN
jgi:hypothetical protein